jgi:tetratricopeptide (TPR) repeat protein
MYQRAIDLRPDFWQNYLSMGNFLLYKGEFENAKAYFRDLIRLRPQSDIGLNNLALSHLSLGEMEEAETHLHAAIAIQPNFSSYNNLGFVYYSQKRYQAAAEQFKKAAEAGGAEEAWINLGDAYRQLEEMQKAKEAYQKAVQLTTRRVQVNPADAFTRASLAYSLAGFGRCKDARTEIEWFSENASQNPLNDYYLAIASSLCNYENLALKHIRSAMEGGLVADVKTNPDLEPLLNHPTLEEFN